MRLIQDQRAVLAHWSYTKQEWDSFCRWRAMRKGFFHYMKFRMSGTRISLPEITITGQKVWTNDLVESFLGNQHKLRRINIRDTGYFNVLEITYERLNGKKSKLREIKIPVPKGKLREAMEVHDCLSGYTF